MHDRTAGISPGPRTDRRTTMTLPEKPGRTGARRYPGAAGPDPGRRRGGRARAPDPLRAEGPPGRPPPVAPAPAVAVRLARLPPERLGELLPPGPDGPDRVRGGATPGRVPGLGCEEQGDRRVPPRRQPEAGHAPRGAVWRTASGPGSSPGGRRHAQRGGRGPRGLRPAPRPAARGPAGDPGAEGRGASRAGDRRAARDQRADRPAGPGGPPRRRARIEG